MPSGLDGFQDSCTEGEAASKGTQSQLLSGFEVWEQFVQAERDAAGRGVSVMADIAENLGANAALDGINDPLVCLVGYDQV